jgi:hypothetical protein
MVICKNYQSLKTKWTWKDETGETFRILGYIIWDFGVCIRHLLCDSEIWKADGLWNILVARMGKIKSTTRYCYRNILEQVQLEHREGNWKWH